MSFTAFLMVVVFGGIVLMVVATALKPVVGGLFVLLRALFGSPGGWALIAAAVIIGLLASGGFLNALL